MAITFSRAFKKLIHVAFLSQLIILSGCGKSVETTIRDSIELEIYKKLNSEITGSKVEIKALENSGTEVAPNYKSRFVATVKLSKPRYKQIDIIKVPGGGSFNLIEQIYSVGDKIEAFGTSSSKIAAEKLVTRISIDSFGSDVGDLYEDFGSPLIKGSKEHKEITEEIERAEDAMGEAVMNFRKTLIGAWNGSYICRNEEYKFTLELTNIYMVRSATLNGDSKIVLEARHKEMINTESFELSGTLGVDGSFELNPTKWINRIDGNLNGYLGKYEEGTDKIAGDMTHARGCTTFIASRS